MSYQNPTIGNQGAYTRSFQQGSPPFPMGGGGEQFSQYTPQYSNPYAGVGVSSVTPEPSALPAIAQPTNSKGGGLSSLLSGGGKAGGSSFNIGQVKQIIDKLGGIEGIVDTMSKVQRMVQSVQQMAPLVKVLMGSFTKGKKGSAADSLGSGRKKRRRRKTNAAGKRRPKPRTRR